MVVHAAGVLDDSLIALMDGESLRRVMAPKVDAAIHLHELTEHMPVRKFVLFSSAVAPIGSPGRATTRRPTRSSTRSRRTAAPVACPRRHSSGARGSRPPA